MNSGVSNVANGAAGDRDAREMTLLVASELGLHERDVLVASTGVIGQPLPMREIRAGIPRAAAELSPSGWGRAARAILTTDLRPKLVSARVRGASVLGIAKGSGMVMPNMATMLAYVVTDLAVQPAALRAVLRSVVADTFNCLTIDGEMSTSDSVVVLANGAAGNRPLDGSSPRSSEFARVLRDVCGELCEKLAADGEGATRLADVIVTGARSHRLADRVARSIANSALVKTALFGADPNWGRVVQAIGSAGVPLDPKRIGIRIAGVSFMQNGEPAADRKDLRRAERAMREKRVAIEVTLGRGPGRAKLLTTDLSYEYVRINAEYTT